MQNKALFTALCVALFAAAIAVPVNEDLQTKEEFGAVKNAIGSAANKFSSWLKGKECQLRSCSGCETKTKRSWGRRRLLADTDADAEWWKTTKYTDCSVRNKCLAENAGCTAKISALKSAVAALDVEIAEAKKVAAAHAATAAEKDKIKDLQAKEAAAAKKALDDRQTMIANLAKDLASEKKSQQTTKDNMEDAVKGTGDDVKDAKHEHSKKAKELKEFNEKMAAPAKREAKAREDIKLAEAAHAAQIAEAKKANAAMAVRVAAAQAKLKAAEGGLGALAAKHQKEAGEAAGAASAAAAAHALKNVKNAAVKLHQDQRNATAKKIESMQLDVVHGPVDNACDEHPQNCGRPF
jgi:hypothetical protein